MLVSAWQESEANPLKQEEVSPRKHLLDLAVQRSVLGKAFGQLGAQQPALALVAHLSPETADQPSSHAMAACKAKEN